MKKFEIQTHRVDKNLVTFKKSPLEEPNVFFPVDFQEIPPLPRPDTGSSFNFIIQKNGENSWILAKKLSPHISIFSSKPIYSWLPDSMKWSELPPLKSKDPLHSEMVTGYGGIVKFHLTWRSKELMTPSLLRDMNPYCAENIHIRWSGGVEERIPGKEIPFVPIGAGFFPGGKRLLIWGVGKRLPWMDFVFWGVLNPGEEIVCHPFFFPISEFTPGFPFTEDQFFHFKGKEIFFFRVEGGKTIDFSGGFSMNEETFNNWKFRKGGRSPEAQFDPDNYKLLVHYPGSHLTRFDLLPVILGDMKNPRLYRSQDLWALSTSDSPLDSYFLPQGVCSNPFLFFQDSEYLHRVVPCFEGGGLKNTPPGETPYFKPAFHEQDPIMPTNILEKKFLHILEELNLPDKGCHLFHYFDLTKLTPPEGFWCFFSKSEKIGWALIKDSTSEVIKIDLLYLMEGHHGIRFPVQMFPKGKVQILDRGEEVVFIYPGYPYFVLVEKEFPGKNIYIDLWKNIGKLTVKGPLHIPEEEKIPEKEFRERGDIDSPEPWDWIRPVPGDSAEILLSRGNKLELFSKNRLSLKKLNFDSAPQFPLGWTKEWFALKVENEILLYNYQLEKIGRFRVFKWEGPEKMQWSLEIFNPHQAPQRKEKESPLFFMGSSKVFQGFQVLDGMGRPLNGEIKETFLSDLNQPYLVRFALSQTHSWTSTLLNNRDPFDSEKSFPKKLGQGIEELKGGDSPIDPKK